MDNVAMGGRYGGVNHIVNPYPSQPKNGFLWPIALVWIMAVGYLPEIAISGATKHSPFYSF